MKYPQISRYLFFIALTLFSCGKDPENVPGPSSLSNEPAEITVVMLDSIPDGSGYTYIAVPTGTGPFPAILYNHGGLGPNVGGNLRETARALAEAGYVARSEKRAETFPIAGHLAEVEQAFADLKAHPDVDIQRMGMIGFSRGGLLTLQAGIIHSDELCATVCMAPAAAGMELSNTLADVSMFNDSLLIMVALNDLYQDDHVQLAKDVQAAMVADSKNSRLIEYPEFDANFDNVIDSNDDGHELFWEVREPYWPDLIQFLDRQLK
jgi:dienelactone hydrolase